MASQIGCGLAWSAHEPKAMRDSGGTALRAYRGGRQRGGGHELGEGATVEHGGHRNDSIPGLGGTIVKRHLKHALELAFVPIAAAIVFFEEVLLRHSGTRHGGRWRCGRPLPAWKPGCAGCRRGRRCWRSWRRRPWCFR